MKHKTWTRVPGVRRVGKFGPTAALLSTGLALTLTYAAGQDSPKAPQTDAKASQSPGAKAAKQTPPAANKAGKSGTQPPALHVVPIPRPGRAAGAGQGGSPITITPLGSPPGGGLPGGPPPGGPAFPPSRDANSAPGGTKMSFTFNGADISNVLKFYAKASHQTIIADPTLTGNVTIINPEPVSLNDAFMILQQVLSARGFSAIEQQGVISIVPFNVASQTTPYINTSVNQNGPTAVDPRDQVMTQVIPLENVEAQTLARELTPLINKGASLVASSGTNSLVLTDTASNVQRFIVLTSALDKASTSTELRTYPLRRADANSIADTINNLYKQISPRGGSAGGPPQPGQPFNPGMQGQPGGAAAGQPAVLAVADARTNSVLVVASPDNQAKIATDIINRLDGDDSNTLDMKIRKIIYANSVDVANMVNQVLNNMMGSQSGGSNTSTFQNRAFGGGGGFFGGLFGGGQQNQNQQSVSSMDPLGKVVAEPRTNSVIITASVDRMKRIDALIDDLDQDVPKEPTTFVFQLKNAQAEDVSTALGQAFGTSTSGNGSGNNIYNFGGNNAQPSSSNRKQIQRRLGTSTNSTNGRGVGRSNVPPGPPNAPDGGDQGDGSAGLTAGSAVPQGVPGVMTANGFVPTEPVARPNANIDPQQTRQFGFFGGGGRQSNTMQTAPVYAPGQTGNYVNLLQLQNNVTVTASPGGDSIIVTTPPANYNAVKAIVDALDVVPRQVLIETIVAEVTLGKDQKLGYALQGLFTNIAGRTNTGETLVNLGQNGNGFNQGTNGISLDPLATGTQFVINGANYTGLLQALQNDTNVKILAATDVFTSNNQEADTNSSEEVPYVQGTTSTGFTAAVSSNIVFQQIGYELDVTPRITREGGVTMDVDTIATSLLGFQTLDGNQVPIVNQRETNTEATADDGQTVVIGGLIQSTDTRTISRIPLLSDIPLIGQFFRSRERNQQRSELVIFLTPHVVNTAAEARTIKERMGKEVSKQIPELGQHEPNLNFKPNAKTQGLLPTPPQNRSNRKAPATAPAPSQSQPSGLSQPMVPGLPQTQPNQ